MIGIGAHRIDLGDPLVIAALGIGAVLLLLLLLVWRASARSAQVVAPLGLHMMQLSQRVQALSDGQQQLAGGLHHVSDAQATSQAKMLQLMELRLAEVNRTMIESLHGSATRTARGWPFSSK